MEVKLIYEKTSNRMRVTVRPSYQEEISSGHNFFWEYLVSVENTGNATVQLVGRYWEIICADGSIQEVFGDNIVGEQPILKPGEAFEYKSFAHLRTSSGIMKGHYIMMSKGKEFDIEIPSFSLDNPYEKTSIN